MSYTYTSKGYKFVEYDDEPPRMRSSCIKCEQDFPENMPETPSKVTEDVHIIFRDEVIPGYGTESIPCPATEDEIKAGTFDHIEQGEAYWTCPHCNYEHTFDEIWIY